MCACRPHRAIAPAQAAKRPHASFLPLDSCRQLTTRVGPSIATGDRTDEEPAQPKKSTTTTVQPLRRQTRTTRVRPFSTSAQLAVIHRPCHGVRTQVYTNDEQCPNAVSGSCRFASVGRGCCALCVVPYCDRQHKVLATTTHGIFTGLTGTSLLGLASVLAQLPRAHTQHYLTTVLCMSRAPG